MKKFWKRRDRGHNASLSDEVSKDLQRELLKQVALIDEDNSSPVISSPKRESVAQSMREPVAQRQSVAQKKLETLYESQSKRETSYKSVNDNVSVDDVDTYNVSVDDADTVDSSTFDETTISTRKPPIAKSVTNYKTKVMKAYSCFSGSVYTVATGMDSLLTSCTNTCCVEIKDEETSVHNSLEKKSTDSLTIDSASILD